MKVLTAHIRNDLREIGTITEKFENFAKDNKLSQRIVYDISLCLDELITNIISYGYDDKKTHEIEVKFELHEKELKLTLIDDGKAFDPTKKEDPEHLQHAVEDRPIGGLGIYLVKKQGR